MADKLKCLRHPKSKFAKLGKLGRSIYLQQEGDFAIVLRPDDKLGSALPSTSRYANGSVLSFDQTRYGPIINKPITLSIEIKTEGESLQKAEIQLAIWVAAHLTRVRDLLDESKSGSTGLTWLFLLIARGPQWHFLFVSRRAAGTTASLCNSQELIED
jgi:hypothetical protein